MVFGELGGYSNGCPTYLGHCVIWWGLVICVVKCQIFQTCQICQIWEAFLRCDLPIWDTLFVLGDLVGYFNTNHFQGSI